MTHEFEKLSDALQAARDRMADLRHGGIVLTGEDLEETIRNFSRFAALARSMEERLTESDRLQKAGISCRVLVNGRGAAVLSAFRGDKSNVVPFIRRPAPHSTQS